MSLKRLVNALLAPLHAEVVRKEGAKEKPWDHTFKEGVKATRQSGEDPNEAVRAAWGDPDWLRYYEPLVKDGDVVCEVGPGAGRWTQPILDRLESDPDYAEVRGAYLRVAKFHRTDLKGADLRGAEGLTGKQIDRAILDCDTRLPPDVTTETGNGD